MLFVLLFFVMDLLQFKPQHIKDLFVSILFNTRCTDMSSLSLFSDLVIKLWSLQKYDHRQ